MSSSGCDGGSLGNSYNYVSKKGLESDKDYPYLGKIGYCKYDEDLIIF